MLKDPHKSTETFLKPLSLCHVGKPKAAEQYVNNNKPKWYSGEVLDLF